ncbi:hypothetical protein TNCV_2007401 [Trichonephila clavipes]|nr:hypothetical protein TNCV_2007401 [Trichonephila clavipes]
MYCEVLSVGEGPKEVNDRLFELLQHFCLLVEEKKMCTIIPAAGPGAWQSRGASANLLERESERHRTHNGCCNTFGEGGNCGVYLQIKINLLLRLFRKIELALEEMDEERIFVYYCGK